jgi:hypothetical protein
MTTSDRAAAMGALRQGFIIVERLAWLGVNILQLRALVRPTPVLRPQ